MLSSLTKCNNILSFFQHVMSIQTSHPDFQFFRRSRKENFVQHQFRSFQSNSIILACYETKEWTNPEKYTGFQFNTFTPFQRPSCIRGEVGPSTLAVMLPYAVIYANTKLPLLQPAWPARGRGRGAIAPATQATSFEELLHRQCSRGFRCADRWKSLVFRRFRKKRRIST